MSILSLINTFVNRYEATPEPVIDFVEELDYSVPEIIIHVGDVVKFYSEDTKTWEWGIYKGHFADLSPSGDSSPNYNEAVQGIHRVAIEELYINGHTAGLRTTYVLVDDLVGWAEVDTNPFWHCLGV